MRRVEGWRAGQEHVRAQALDNAYPILLAESHGRLCGRPRRHAAIHPDVLDAGFSAVLDDLVGRLLVGHDQNAIDARLDVLDSRETGLTVDLIGNRIDRDRLVQSLAELLPQHRSEAFGIARDADDGDALEGQEIVDLLLGGHLGSSHVDVSADSLAIRPSCLKGPDGLILELV